MPTYDITSPDGKTYEVTAPEGATQDQVLQYVQQQHAASAPPPLMAAPRWDVLGDVGRAAKTSANSLVGDAKAAFPNPNTMDLGPLASIKRMGSALKVPFDAAGIALSPLTGFLHGTGGSALSHIVPMAPPPKTNKDYGPIGNFISTHAPALETDPKKAGDQGIDLAMLGLAPSDPAAIAAAAPQRAAAAQARAEAKLTNKALARVGARAEADQLNPQDIIAAQREALARGDQLTLMDLGGKNVKGLAGAVYRAPGPAGQAIDTALETRDAAATKALTSEVETGVGKGSTFHTVNDLTKARSQASRPAYEAAESVGPVHSPRLDRFLEQPEVQEGIRRGLKLERQNAVAEDRPFVDSDYGVIGYKDGNWDMPIFGNVPTMKQLIVANEGLGAKVGEMVDQFGRLTKDGLAMKKLHESYLAELDRLNPKYAKARQEWSGPSQSMNAVREGRTHFSRDDSIEQIKSEFDALSEADKDFYRLGAAEAKITKLKRAPDASDKSKRIINSEDDRDRFRILFKSDAEAEDFIKSVARKRTQFETKQDIKGGSQTAGRLADDANENVPLLLNGASALGHVGGGNLLSAAHSLYRLKRDLGLRNNPALNSEIARIMLNPDLGAAGQQPFAPLLVPPRVKNPLTIPATANSAAASQHPKN